MERVSLLWKKYAAKIHDFLKCVYVKGDFLQMSAAFRYFLT